MYQPPGVKTSPALPISDRMKAWVLGDPDQLLLLEKPVPIPSRAEVLIRIDAVAICATDLEIIHSGSPASIEGGLPFKKNFTPGHEYMARSPHSGPTSTNSRSESGSAWRSTPAVASASVAAKACIRHV